MQNLYENIIEVLKAAQASYRITQHRAIFTSKEAAALELDESRGEIKTLALCANSDYIIITLLEKERINLKALSQLIKTSKINLVPPNLLQDKFGTVAGGLAPFGYRNHANTSVYILDSVLGLSKIFISPGKNDITLEISNADFQKVVAIEQLKILRAERYTE